MSSGMVNAKICHLTSVHHRNDTRVFYKEIASIAKAGYHVSVIVADGKGDETREGYDIIDVGRSKNRINRILFSTRKVYKKAIEIDADVYHFHDPELLFTGKKLKKKNKKVIYDAHEDVPKQILSKYWINATLRRFISTWVENFENKICSKLDLIITATPFIRERFLKVNPNTIDINNFPILNSSQSVGQWKNKKRAVCYIGSITEVRGVYEMVESFSKTDDVVFHLAGTYSPEDFRRKLQDSDGWKNVKEYGFVKRDQADEIMDQCIAGLVTLHPIINYLDSLPVKMFEYMSAGIAVIASNFPNWMEIIEENKCGICVDPKDPQKITEAITYLMNNQEKAQEMGARGFNLVQEKFNWENEKVKLLDSYKKLAEK
jgi:glycosyltransferase involved in cell wall biosynthesis